jgi:hypothetical protein
VATCSPASAQTVDANPALAHLEIDIWPEFDRPSSALVILRAEIAPDVTLPASVSLRIPAASGGPAAVATAASAEARLLTLPYERSDVQLDFMTISFAANDRFFHVESLRPHHCHCGESSASHMGWRFRYRADHGATPGTALSSAVTAAPRSRYTRGAGGRIVLSRGERRPTEAGQSLNVDVQYTKSDARTPPKSGIELGNPKAVR